MRLSGRFAIAIILMMAIFIAGCNFGPAPKDVLSKYLDNTLRGNYDKAYELLSARDKAVKSQQEFSGETEELGGLMKGLASKVTYNVKEVKITGDKALATVDVTMPDLSGAVGELLGLAMQSAFGGVKPDDKAMEKLFTEKLKDKNLPTITKTDQYDLVKDKDGWRVYMGWENIKKIQALKAEADKLETQKKFAEAKAKYVEVQGLSSRDETVPKKIKELEEKAARYKEIQAYIQNIEVRGVHTGRGVLGDIGVFGEVKNKGDRTLKKVEITTYCLDKSRCPPGWRGL